MKLCTIISGLLAIFAHKISPGHFQSFSEGDERKLNADDLRVNISQGVLEGTEEFSRDGRAFVSFKGIPFGKIKQRFNNAEPADGWQGVKQANEYGPHCPQVNIMTHQFSGQEDCLTLNVFAPITGNKSALLPVMVHIYGGAFVMGFSSNYQPKYFMDEDVIVVTLNYRVGAFGFLNAGIKGASGNQAMKDMVLALKWVQNNIGAFGGDPSHVTVFGQSAGGAAVALLVASPMTKGLFSAAIAQSGVATVGWALWPDPEYDEPKRLAHAVDCPTSNREYMIDCLRKIKPEVLALATDFKDAVWFERESTPVFAPSIEDYKDTDEENFLSENIETMLDKGTFNRVPFMVGFTSHEGLSLHAAPILLNPNNTRRMNEQWGRVAPQALFYWKIARDPCVVSSKLRKAYFKGKPVGLETADGLIDLYSHIGFQYPARKVGIKHAKFAPVYMYNFTKHVTVSFVDLYGFYKYVPASSKRPVHGDDIQFAFNGLRLWPDIKKSSPDYEFSKNFVKFLVSFARHHKPTFLWGSTLNETTTIEPVNATAERVNWLKIDNDLSIETESDDFLTHMKLLDEICEHDFDQCSSLHMK